MAIIPLGTPKTSKESQGEDSDFKPLVKAYGKLNPSIYGEVHPVISGRISASGDWCILETADYALLLRSKNSAVTSLFNDILPNIDRKKGFELVVQPDKKNKNGGVLAVDDENQCWYEVAEDGKSFETSDKEPGKQAKKQEGLTLEMFIGTKGNTTSEEVGKQQETENIKKSRTRKKEEEPST